MPDIRFYEDLGPVALADIAAATGSELAEGSDPSLMIHKVAVLARADAQSLTFVADKKYLADLETSGAGACVVPLRLASEAPANCSVLVAKNPQAVYALAALMLHRPHRHSGTACISPDARLEDGVDLAPGVVIGQGAQIGRGTQIGANTVIGPGVTIGRNCRIGSNVSISFAMIGDRVMIYANAVIGEAGFGATLGPSGIIDIPQLGRVIIQDGVTLGAGVTVDRGAYEDTSIGENTKIDNLVHIGHNTKVGRNCVMAAFVGISGSVTIGDGARFGGRAGIADHITIGDGAQVGGAAGVLKDIPAGETWSGYPAQPLRKWLREVNWLSKSAARPRSGGNDE